MKKLHLIALLGITLTNSPTILAGDGLELVERYQSLSNQHRVDELLMLYADDAELDFGPMGVIRGKEQIRGIHEYDRAIDTVLSMHHCQSDANGIACQTVEKNNWLRTAGIAEINYDKTVISLNKAGLIERVSAQPSPESGAVLGRAMQEFGAWAQAHEPSAYAELFRDDGSFIFGYESGQRVLNLLQQWKSATRSVE